MFLLQDQTISANRNSVREAGFELSGYGDDRGFNDLDQMILKTQPSEYSVPVGPLVA